MLAHTGSVERRGTETPRDDEDKSRAREDKKEKKAGRREEKCDSVFFYSPIVFIHPPKRVQERREGGTVE